MSEGSNIDLGEIHQVIADIKAREHQLEQAERDAKQALDNYNATIQVYEKSYAEAYLGEVDAVNITTRKMATEMATVDEKVAMNTAHGIQRYFESRVRSCKALLSSAQSRASLLKEQLRL